MGIGQTKQIQLVQIASTQGTGGAWTESEGEKYGCWAEISNPSGVRVYERGQRQISTTKTFKVRFRFDKYPNVNWKVIYDGKDWDIHERQAQDEKRFYWLITATAKADV